MNKTPLIIAAIVACTATAAYSRGGAAGAGRAGGAKSFGAASMSSGTFGKSGMATLGHNESGGFGMTGTHLASTQPQAKSGTMIGPVNDNGTSSGTKSATATRARVTSTGGTVPGNAREGASQSGTSSSKSGTMIGPVNDNSTSSGTKSATATRARVTSTGGTVPGNAREGSKAQAGTSTGGH